MHEIEGGSVEIRCASHIAEKAENEGKLILLLGKTVERHIEFLKKKQKQTVNSGYAADLV